MDTASERFLHVQALSGHHALDYGPHHVGVAEHGLAAGLLLGEVVHQLGRLGDHTHVSAILRLQQLGYLREGSGSELSGALEGRTVEEGYMCAKVRKKVYTYIEREKRERDRQIKQYLRIKGGGGKCTWYWVREATAVLRT